MKYKLGDFVRFVDEKMEGFVTRIIDGQMIGVTGDDDFEIPVLASKVTTVHGYETGIKDAAGVMNNITVPVEEFVTKGVFLGMVHDAKINSFIYFHLINTTSFQLLAALTTENQLSYKGEFAGIIEPASAVKIYSAQLADLQLWPKLLFDVTFYTTQNMKSAAPLHISEKLKTKDFAGTKKKLPMLNDPGWMIQLDEPELVIDAQQLKESFYKPASEKAEVMKPAAEVDLHIEKLRTDYQFIHSNEMLGIQLAHFHKLLDAAIVHQLPEITFIHGTGNGILKNEIHKALSKSNKIKTFMDARKEKFGYGATKVILN